MARGRNLSIILPNKMLVDVKVHRVHPVGVREPVIVTRDQEGEKITKKRQTDTGLIFDKFHWVTVNTEGDIYKPEKTFKYEVLDDGSEELVTFPESTKRVEWSTGQMLPANYVGTLLPEKQYEIVAKNPDEILLLYNEAEALLDKDMVYYTSPFIFKKGSKKQYHAIFQPYMSGKGKFGWLMFTTMGKTEYEHSMEVVAEPTETRTPIKTIESLASLLKISV